MSSVPDGGVQSNVVVKKRTLGTSTQELKDFYD